MELHYTANIEANRRKLQHVRDVACLTLGASAGIMALESFFGFVYYFLFITFTNIGFWYYSCERKPHRYFVHPFREIFLENILTDMPGFVMMWCFMYALVKSNS